MNAPILHFISPPIPYFVDCGHASYEVGDYHIDRNCIGVFDLIVVVKGLLPVGENGILRELGEGEGVILLPDGHHYGFAPCTVPTEIIWIHFQTFGSWQECADMNECLLNQQLLFEEHKNKAYVHHTDLCSIFLPRILKISAKAMELLELFFEQESEPKSLRNWRRQASFQSFLQHLDRSLASPSDATAIHLAEQIELYIRNNYMHDLTNPVLQKELNYHPNYLAKSMLKVFGMTPMAYLQYYRIEQSKRLLLQTSWSVARIAEEVGFHHVSHYSSCFSKKEGLSPSAFRSKFVKER
ncbi:response regulator transcription factor [Paenibacillus sp. DMB5]|uniref:helix-turn-helix transcriptional regulator n=1 Tax=Paenibacillus sp. DMB5 TaxID=1780103 RepID=UPI00076D5771|nr:response regulator transcription factor [Paenibacillus sp. DMB5]KUP25536.1 AraC family transcriptional regulator [Paenibacillus sp. DMB5]